jgi:coenzyme F420-reducing hydrogenase gamma subunit
MVEFLEILNEKYFDWADKIDVRHCRILKEKNVLDEMDVAVVEGAVSSDKEAERLVEIRRLAKKVVAIGSCAISGAPNNYRNYFDQKTIEEIKPILDRFGHRPKVTGIKEVIKVDAEVPGCPILHSKFIEVIENYMKEFGAIGEDGKMGENEIRQ